MPFRLTENARTWFKELESRHKELLGFDFYYYCLMAGLATGKARDVGEATDLVNDFPGPYKKNGRLIISLFLSRHLRDAGIRLTERADLHAEIRRLIDANEPTRLSEYGMRELNRYASGGCEALREDFAERPRHLETFLPAYKVFLDRCMDFPDQ